MFKFIENIIWKKTKCNMQLSPLLTCLDNRPNLLARDVACRPRNVDDFQKRCHPTYQEVAILL